MASTQIIYNLIARDGASSALRQVGRSMDDLGRKHSSLSTALKAGAAAVGTAVVAGGIAAVRMAADFQTQMTRVRTGAGELQKNMGAVSSGVLKMAGQVGVSTQQLTAGLYTVESAGYHGADALNVLRASAMGAKVGAAELGTVTDAVTTALNAYKLGASQSTAVTNALIATESEGKTTLEDLAGSLSNVLPTAAAAKVGLQEVLGAMATMTSQGTPAVQAATYLRQVIGQLSNPSAKAATEMANLGLSAVQVGQELGTKGLAATLTTLTDAIEKKMGPAGTVLIQHLQGAAKNTTTFQRALANLPPTQQTYIGALATMVGGTKSMQAALELTGPHMKDFIKNTDGISEHVKAGGKNIEGWSAVEGTFNQKLAEAKDGLQALAIQLGTKFLPAGTAFVGFLGKTVIPAAGRFATYLTGTAIPAVEHFGSSLVNRFVPVAQIKKDFDALKSNVGDFMSGVFPKTPKAPVLPVPMLKPFSTPSAFTIPPPPPSAAKKAGDQIRQMFSTGIANGLKSINWGDVGKTLGAGLGKALDALASLGGKVAGTLGSIIGGIDWLSLGKTVGGQALPFIIGFVNNLLAPLFSGAFWSKHWSDILMFAVTLIPIGKIVGPLAKVFEKIPFLKVFAPLLRGVEALAKPFVKAFDAIFGFLGKAFKDGFSKEFPKAEGALGKFIGKVGYAIWSKAVDIAAAAEKMIGGAAQGIGRGAGKALRAVLRFTKLLLTPFAKAGTWLLQKGADLVSGLLSGVASIAKTVGRFLLDKVIKPTVEPFAKAGSWLLQKGMDVVSGLKNGVVRIATSIGGWIYNTVVKPLLGVFVQANQWLFGGGIHLLEGLKNGIVNAIKGIGGWVKSNIVDPVVNAVKHFFGIHSPSTVFAELGGHLTAGLLRGMAATGGTAIAKLVFGDLPSALGAIVGKGLVAIGSLPGKALSALGNLGSKLGGFFKHLFGGGGGGGGTSQWAGDVQAVLAMLGAPQSALSAVLTRIGIESGGNPNAINLWDSNAKAGHPSQGLMQTIPSTFNTYAGPFRSRGITDPLANIYAGVNYAMHAYGSDWINVMTRPGGYASGGRPRPGELAWVGEQGPELMRFAGGETIYDHRTSMRLAGSSRRRSAAPQPAQPQVHVHVHLPDALSWLEDFIEVRIEQGHEQLIGALDAGAGWQR